MRERLTQLLSVILFIGLWAIASSMIGPDILPGPVEVFPRLSSLIASGRFLGPLVESLVRTTLGFTTGFVGGLAYGIAAAKLPMLSRSTSVPFNVLLFAPTLIIIFLLLVMLGPQITTVVLITGLVVGPTVAVYMRDVMGDLDPDLLSLADSFKVTVWRRIRDIYLPYLVPPMLAAARIGFSIAWKVVMLAEVFGFPGGLGFQIRISYSAYDLPRLLAWLSIFILALLAIEQLIRGFERRFVKWQT
jgi:ABC-type nitrate/sulfonate/bicarbonate transport system permease component